MKEGLVEWNRLESPDEQDRTVPGARLIGHDALGGFFALNGGRWPGQAGSVFYWGQDTLEWTNLEMTYSGWLQWLLAADLNQFYEAVRWSGWEDEVSHLTADEGISVYPFLWAEGEAISSRRRAVVPMRELWDVSQAVAIQLRDLPDGHQVDIRVIDGPNA